MKNIFKIIPVVLFALSCKAQSPIININNRPDEDITGAYYKDIENLFDLFEGVYICNIRGAKLEVTLQKKLLNYNSIYYEDLLVGEYKYTNRNNIVVEDRLNELTGNYTDNRNHSLKGHQILQYGDYLCRDCSVNETRLYGGLVDKIGGRNANILISIINVDGQPAIKLWVGWQMKTYKLEDGPSPPPTIPGGEYIMIKQ